MSNSLVALGATVVLTVYSAGYLRTRAAAEKLADAEVRRPPMPAPPEAGPAPVMPEPPSVVALKSTNPVSKPRPKSDSPAVTATPTAPVESHATDPKPVDAVSVETKPVESKPTEPKPIESKLTDPAPPAPPAAPAPSLPAGLYRDGTFYGWGTSRHGDIQASIVIRDGRITEAAITQCLTRYSCSWIAHLQPQVVARQSAEVDYVSGATQSTNAFYYAILEALFKAK